jgi:hypothetical protein
LLVVLLVEVELLLLLVVVVVGGGIVGSRTVSPLLPEIITRGRQFGAFGRDELQSFVEGT